MEVVSGEEGSSGNPSGLRSRLVHDPGVLSPAKVRQLSGLTLHTTFNRARREGLMLLGALGAL